VRVTENLAAIWGLEVNIDAIETLSVAGSSVMLSTAALALAQGMSRIRSISLCMIWAARVESRAILSALKPICITMMEEVMPNAITKVASATSMMVKPACDRWFPFAE
jgi:hypothetical protein